MESFSYFTQQYIKYHKLEDNYKKLSLDLQFILGTLVAIDEFNKRSALLNPLRESLSKDLIKLSVETPNNKVDSKVKDCYSKFTTEYMIFHNITDISETLIKRLQNIYFSVNAILWICPYDYGKDIDNLSVHLYCDINLMQNRLKTANDEPKMESLYSEFTTAYMATNNITSVSQKLFRDLQTIFIFTNSLSNSW